MMCYVWCVCFSVLGYIKCQMIFENKCKRKAKKENTVYGKELDRGEFSSWMIQTHTYNDHLSLSFLHRMQCVCVCSHRNRALFICCLCLYLQLYYGSIRIGRQCYADRISLFPHGNHALDGIMCALKTLQWPMKYLRVFCSSSLLPCISDTHVYFLCFFMNA